MVQMQKNKDPERWLLHKRNGQAPSAVTAALFKAEAEGRTFAGEGSLVHTAGQSLGPGGRRLKAVDSGMNGLFDDDEDGVDSKRKREKEYGGEGDADEFEFEEEFADDEEVVDVDETKDDETKEMEVHTLILCTRHNVQLLIFFTYRNVLNENTGTLTSSARATWMRTLRMMTKSISLGQAKP